MLHPWITSVCWRSRSAPSSCSTSRRRRWLPPTGLAEGSADLARLSGVTDTPATSLYERAGGMPFFEALVGRFYDGVETDPILRPLYPEPTLAGARHRLTLFLAQYWGGPTTYDQERGHPRLRMRRSRSVQRRAMRGSCTCVPPWPSSGHRPTSRRTWITTWRWPRRRCATGADHHPSRPRYTGSSQAAG